MKKNDYIGWQEVFRFSLIQGMKEKAYYSFLIVMSVILICSMPAVRLISSLGGEEEAYQSEVTDFTIYDETGLGIDFTNCLEGEGFDTVTIHTTSDRTYEDHVEALEEQSKQDTEDQSRELIVRVTYEEEGYFNLVFVKASNAALGEEDCEKIADTFEAFFDRARIEAIEVTDEQLAFLNRTVDTKLEFITEAGEVVPQKDESDKISMEEYMVLLMGITVVTMIISLSGSSIATSIVTEKSTRVVEYLMINIRPMALIVGKILASLVLVMIQFAVMIISYFISAILNLLLFPMPEMSGDMVVVEGGEEMEISALLELASRITIEKVLIAVVVVLCGIMFYSIMAGLAGASVSKIDELAEGLKVYQIVMVVGAYLSMGMCMVLMMGGENQLLINICSLFPISAPFVVPTGVLVNKVPMGVALISLGILLLFTALLFAFTARVYESMIFYNGSVLKLKDILQIAKRRAPAERKEEAHREEGNV